MKENSNSAKSPKKLSELIKSHILSLMMLELSDSQIQKFKLTTPLNTISTKEKSLNTLDLKMVTWHTLPEETILVESESLLTSKNIQDPLTLSTLETQTQTISVPEPQIFLLLEEERKIGSPSQLTRVFITQL